MKRIAVCGGHLTPAIATIEQLQKEKGIELIFFGRKYAAEGSKTESAEFMTVKKLGIKFAPISTGRLQRKFTPYTIPSLFKIPQGLFQSLLNLKTEKPQVVVSFGSYVSTPVVFAAWLLRIPIISHIQTQMPGIADIIAEKFSKKVYLTWPSISPTTGGKFEVIGLPVREAILKAKNSAKLEKFIKFDNRPTIFVTAGNQGSHFLNNLIFNSFVLFKKYKIIHQIGTLNYQKGNEKAYSLQKAHATSYRVQEYFDSKDMGYILKHCKFVISRSGANTVYELALLGKVAILIPLPIAAGGEQYQNAQILQKAGSARTLAQSEASTTSLAKEIEEIAKNFNSYEIAAQNLKSKIPKDSARKLAKAIVGYT